MQVQYEKIAIYRFTVCCQRCDRQPGVINTVSQVLSLIAGSKRRSLLMAGDDDKLFVTRSLNVTPKTTEEHFILRSDESEAYVSKNRRLHSTFCTLCSKKTCDHVFDDKLKWNYPFSKTFSTVITTVYTYYTYYYRICGHLFFKTQCTIEANYWQARSIAQPLCDSRATCNACWRYLCQRPRATSSTEWLFSGLSSASMQFGTPVIQRGTYRQTSVPNLTPQASENSWNLWCICQVRLAGGGIMFSTRSLVRSSVTRLANTIFWKWMKRFWCQLAQMVHIKWSTLGSGCQRWRSDEVDTCRRHHSRPPWVE